MDSSYFSLTNVAAAIGFFTILRTIFSFFYGKFRSHQETKKMEETKTMEENKTMVSSLLDLSSLPRNGKHHVFPSFHGADVRRSFLSHILKEFRSKAIDPFIDNNIERSKSIGPQLIEAITGSRIAIVLLSKNYASSTWCLDELVEIIKCREVLGQTVMVLFYEVNPTDVKKQTGEFGEVFRKTCQGKTEDHIGRWKQALAEVAQIAGYHSNNWDNDANMIEKVATDVSNKLNNSTPSSDFDNLVGMESHMRKMGPLLRLDLEEVRIIGILGLPGIGKTTIARFLFDCHSEDFQLTVFMGDIKTRYALPACSDDYSVKLYLQEQFLSQLINQVGIKIPHLGIAKDRLKDKKVLVVLDNVDQLEQVQAMANETSWFGPCSRIIITTQDEKLLRQSGVNHIYKVDLPSSDEALEIFCMYAFGQKSPKDGFMELAIDVTRLAGELPLGLKVMGSYFKGLSKKNWSKKLPRLRTRLDGKIENILKLSYEALGHEDKKLFLHIACFFSGERIDVVEGCLERFFGNVTPGLHILAEKSLISLDDKIVKMHSLLVQLGREIVRNQHSSDPRKRQFLEDIGDVDEVLTDDKAGSSRVIGIDLKFENKDITCTSERASRRFCNLRFLRNDGDGTNFYFPGKLTFVSWKQFPMSCFPPSFHPKFLVKLDMPYSNLEKLWEENQLLNNLKWMDLSYSKSLKKLPCLSSATSLCELRLSGCSSLVELPYSIGKAIHLVNLDLSYCSRLQKIPFSIGDAINLQKLDLSYCESLVEIPSSIRNVIGLQELDLSYCSSLVKLPSSIGNAVNLQKLNLTHCSSLLEVPFSIENAKNLQKMDLNGCSSMVELPFYIERVSDSKYLNFSGCSSLVKLPSSIGNATNLEELNLSFCSSLVKIPSSIGYAINLQKMDLSYCTSLVELPSSMRNLRRLSILDLKKCSKLEVLLSNIHLESLEQLNLSETAINEISYGEIQELGPLIGRITRLRRLVLRGMQTLTSLPQLPDYLQELDAEDCVSLEKLNCVFRNPDIRLNFGKCFKLNQEAKDLIIQTPTSEYTVLTGKKVPVSFNYRASGSSLTVKLNQKPCGTSRFRACILLADKDKYDLGHWGQAHVSWSITSKQNAFSSCSSSGKILESVFPEHLYTFEVEAMGVTSTELFFEFKLRSLHFDEIWEIKECGILQISRDNRSHRKTKTMASSSSPLSLPETKTMASSSSPLSLPTSLPRNGKHHVFPSFHGADISRSFLNHFFKEFKRKGIDIFIDNTIERGKSIGPELIEAIRGSRIAIVLLSKNYASSTWCLDELVEIIKCREVLGQTVMVLFYEVNPTDVKKQTGEFGKAFRKSCKGKTEDHIGRWKQALVEVAKIAGYHSQNWDNDATMIEEIAIDVSYKLNNITPSSDFDNLVGMESHMRKMGPLLRLDLEEVRMIGIWGKSGIGTTTIARSLFNQYSQNFQRSIFMENIRTSYAMPTCSDDYNVKKYLQEQFMSKIINHEGLQIPHLEIVEEGLKDKKVLVVLDDVDQLIQLEAISKETSLFGPSSRIIITTRDPKILQAHGVNHIYEVEDPSSHEALQMFCLNAFGQKSPKDGFQELAWQVTRLAGEHPLALRVMGFYFRQMVKEDWPKAITRLKTYTGGEIESILEFSYDSLDDEDKSLFIHITCFFNGEYVSKVEEYLANSFSNVTRGLQALLEKSLISQSFGMIKMNDLLLQLGRELVRRKSPYELGKRQFLSDARDIDELLRDDKADVNSVIGLDLKFSYEKKEDITCISERAFGRLSNLQFLRIDGNGIHLYFPRSLDSISQNLRFISWTQFPMPCFPSNFSSEFLVNLEMPSSTLQKLWEGIQPLSNLKWMDLSFSESLKEVPDLSTAVNLRTLNLSHCSSLVKLSSSIGNAISLEELDLSHCLSLVELPSSIGNAISLEVLDLSHCSSLLELPSSMKNLCRLSKLDLKKCSKLEVLLTDINLESLKELDLSDCALLRSSPETSTDIGDVKASGIQELGPWIGRISCLRRLVLNGIQKLVSLPQLPYSLVHLDAENCEFLEILDCSFCNPEIRLNFAKCFKLDHEARDLIIKTRTNEYVVLPGVEVPVCFTYRAFESPIRVKLNQNPLPTSKIFRVCIILAEKAEYVSGVEREAYVCCRITSEQKAFTSNSKLLKPVFPEHLYTFEVEAVDLTSTEVVFEFQLLNPNWEIKKCGIIQLMEVPDMHRGRKKERIDDFRGRMRVVIK